MEHKWLFSFHKNGHGLVAEEREGPMDTPCWIITSHVPGTNGVVRICNGTSRKREQAYRAVYEREVGPIPKGKVLCHRCDIPMCVNPEHLFVGTKGDNTRDMLSKMRHRHGEKASWSRLDDISVMFIRRLRYKPGMFSYLAHLLDVSEATIRDAFYGKTWRHLDGEAKTRDIFIQ